MEDLGIQSDGMEDLRGGGLLDDTLNEDQGPARPQHRKGLVERGEGVEGVLCERHGYGVGTGNAQLCVSSCANEAWARA